MGPKFWLFLILAPVIAAFSPVLLGKKKGFLQVVSMAAASILLSCFCFLFANQPGWIEKDSFERLKSRQMGNSNVNGEDPYSFIARHFVLIDNSYSKIQTPLQDSPFGNEALVPVTDRSKLLQVLQVLNRRQELVDLVILDLALKRSTGEDSLLVRELKLLQENGKLLLSRNTLDKSPDIAIFPEEAYGNVREEGNDLVFTSHRIIDEEGKLSMPYQIYRHFTGMESPNFLLKPSLLDERKDGVTLNHASNLFICRFNLVHEQKLFSPEAISVAGKTYTPMPVQLLHQAASEEGCDDLIFDLEKRRQAKTFTAVFVGAFLSPEEDVHRTMYGPMHGPAIILNTFAALVQGQHHFSFLGLALLAFAFFIIHYIATALIAEIQGTDMPTRWLGGAIKSAEESAHQWFFRIFGTRMGSGSKFAFAGYWICRFVYLGVVFFFVEEMSLFLVVILFLMVFLLYGIVLNLTFLLLYFLAYQQILTYFGDSKLKTPSHEQT